MFILTVQFIYYFFKDEYYIIENVAVPIRWCAPETLHCTPTTIETKQVQILFGTDLFYFFYMLMYK